MSLKNISQEIKDNSFRQQLIISCIFSKDIESLLVQVSNLIDPYLFTNKSQNSSFSIPEITEDRNVKDSNERKVFNRLFQIFIFQICEQSSFTQNTVKMLMNNYAY